MGNILSMSPASAARHADLAHLPSRVRNRVTAFRLLLMVGMQLRSMMDRRLAASNLTSQQAALLTVASNRDQAPTQGELAMALGVTHQNIRQLMNALERKGLLAVEIDARDRRMRRAKPTPAVRKLFRRRNHADFAAVAAWFSDLADEEVEQLVGILDRLADKTVSQRARTRTSRPSAQGF